MQADFLAPRAAMKQLAHESFEPVSMDSPERFFNRELSWLAFNWRVLEEAMNPGQPLLERLRFLAISGANLDEFYTVRVAALRSLRREGVGNPSADGLTPAEQLKRIDADCLRLMEAQQHCWRALRAEMADAGIDLVEPSELDAQERDWLEARFLDEMFPVLTPLAIDPAHPFPFIPNKGLALALHLEHENPKRPAIDAVMLAPSMLERFIRLRGGASGRIRFISLENVITLFHDRLFPGYRLVDWGQFRLLRDSDLEIEEEAEDLVREFEHALRRRRRGDVVRLKLDADMSLGLRQRVLAHLEVTDDELIPVDGVIGIADLSQMIVDDLPELRWRPFTPRMPEILHEHGGDIFAAIRERDILAHHPYESFDMVARFITQAAHDPDVLAIKQTLYRTSARSPVVAALCEAAEEGKSVTAVVELKARFDEEANITLARQLERAGVQVVYGFMNWKTHAKISMAVRREGARIAIYTHFGTGNYHPITAKIYTDLSYFTCDPALGRDASKVFNFITGYAQPQEMEKVFVSPLNLKTRIIALIEEEIIHAQAGRPAQIWAKMNSLIEPGVVDALYRASQAGVRIDLVIRGICGLRPGAPGLSENIRVKSVVGRFLEHSRILCFGGGGGLPSDQARVYISSADMMARNLNRRVEVMTEISDPALRAQIVEQIMAANLRDEAQSWILRPDGAYMRFRADAREDAAPPFNCHDYFIANPGAGMASRQEEAPNLIDDEEAQIKAAE